MVRFSGLGRVWVLYVLCALTGYAATQVLAATAVKNSRAPEAASSVSASAPAQPSAQAPVGPSPSGDAPSAPLNRAVSFLGLFIFIGVCYVMSSDRSRIDWRLVAWGMGLQLVFGVLVLKTAPGLWVFQKLNAAAMSLLGFGQEGTNFLFRSFVSGKVEPGLVNFTFTVLPTIIFFSSLMTLGYYAGVMQWVVNFFAVVMRRTMKCSGAETLSTAANIFMGQTEAPLVVKPYIKDMTESELLTVMVGGFANTAGGVLAAYVGMLYPYFPDVAGHLIAQSVMSAPAALVCAKIVMPETGRPLTAGAQLEMMKEKTDANFIDAAARGASEGMTLALNVGAMLLAFIAIIAMLNFALGKVSSLAGAPVLSIETLLGLIGAPVAWAMGVPVQDCWTVGKLIGVKTGMNEFVAYLRMAEILKSGEALSHRSMVIAAYALSGFANFSSIAIQIGGISGIAPGRRHDLARLGLKAMVVGSIATFMTAAVAGILIP
ncbi:MAG TPA: nucleoside transporter C-terminal domain-containing protein [Elusimicrobiales bacterium]|nr:nucleoside transporter C-terminal domain-containing protein [Elusimicrobiales bacterium]